MKYNFNQHLSLEDSIKEGNKLIETLKNNSLFHKWRIKEESINYSLTFCNEKQEPFYYKLDEQEQLQYLAAINLSKATTIINISNILSAVLLDKIDKETAIELGDLIERLENIESLLPLGLVFSQKDNIKTVVTGYSTSHCTECGMKNIFKDGQYYIWQTEFDATTGKPIENQFDGFLDNCKCECEKCLLVKKQIVVDKI